VALAWFSLTGSSKKPSEQPDQRSGLGATNRLPSAAARAGTPTVLTAPRPIILPAIVVRARTIDTNSNSPVVLAVPAESSGFDTMKLQGILYSPGGASAIIDGKTMHQGELISGLHVIEITPTTVTLEYEGRRRTLKLE